VDLEDCSLDIPREIPKDALAFSPAKDLFEAAKFAILIWQFAFLQILTF